MKQSKTLVDNFNRLLNIAVDYFGQTKKRTEKSPAMLRADARLAAKLKANKAIPSAGKMTRQQRRRTALKQAKSARLSAAEFGRRKMKVINPPTKGRLPEGRDRHGIWNINGPSKMSHST